MGIVTNLCMKLGMTNNSNQYFDTDHLKTDLKNLSIRGGAVTITGQGVKFLLQIGSTAMLARLLTPQDFGLIAMVSAITGFILIFKDMGLSMATVQKAEITHEQISTLFWVNVALSLTVMLITFALSPVIAWFYNDPRLIWITLILAFGFVFGGLTVQHQAILKRQMRFTALVIIDVVSMLIGIAIAVISAWNGMKYWSLVFMQLATVLSVMLGTWFSCNWRPGIPVKRSGVCEMLAFGGNLTGFGVINYFARNLDNILIGQYWGAQPLGLYSKAYSLLLLPIGQIVAPVSSVAIPALSRLQDDPRRYRNYYLKAIKMIAYVSMPLITGMSVLSEEIVGLVLGEQWHDSVVIFQILSFNAIWHPVCSTVGWIYVSLNQTRRMAVWGFISCPMIILSFFIGLPWGVKSVALCYTICVCLLVYPIFAFALKYSPITVKDVFSNIYRPFMLAAIVGLGMFAARIALCCMEPIWVILGTLASGGLIILTSAHLWNLIGADISEIIEIGKLVIKKG